MKPFYLLVFVFMITVSNIEAHDCIEVLVSTETILDQAEAHLEIQTLQGEDGKIIFRVLGWIAGYLISDAVSTVSKSVCKSMGGHSDTCSFVGEAAGFLVGMRGGRLPKVKAKTYYAKPKYNSRSSKVTSKTSYDRQRDRGEVEYESNSRAVVDQIGESLVGHLFKAYTSQYEPRVTERYPQQNSTYRQQSQSRRQTPHNQRTIPSQAQHQLQFLNELQRIQADYCKKQMALLLVLHDSYVRLGKKKKVKKTLKEINKLKAECGYY